MLDKVNDPLLTYIVGVVFPTTNRYGVGTAMGENPVPNYQKYDTTKFTLQEVIRARHRMLPEMLEGYVRATRRKASGSGWYRLVTPTTHHLLNTVNELKARVSDWQRRHQDTGAAIGHLD